jgi:branched-subunit amino acid transport protein
MNHKLILFGTMVVTMLPRILPFFLFDAKKLPDWVQDFLSFIPFAVLGALILPGGLSGLSGHPWASSLCLVVSALIAWFFKGIIGPIIGAVSVAVFLQAGGLL